MDANGRRAPTKTADDSRMSLSASRQLLPVVHAAVGKQRIVTRSPAGVEVAGLDNQPGGQCNTTLGGSRMAQGTLAPRALSPSATKVTS